MTVEGVSASDTSRRAEKTHAMAELEDASLEWSPPAPRGGADDNIQVLVRVRPPNARELEQVRVAMVVEVGKR